MTLPLVFISYCHGDKPQYTEELLKHLKPLEKQNELEIWIDKSGLRTGGEINPGIGEAVKRAHLAVQLITPLYLGSDFVNDQEVPWILARRESRHLVQFPIFAEFCSYKSIEWLSGVKLRSENDGPIWELDDGPRRRALATIANEIRDLARESLNRRERSASPVIEDISESPNADAPNRRPSAEAEAPAPIYRRSDRKQLMYLITVLVLVISVWLYVFQIANATYDSGPIKISKVPNLLVKPRSKKYLSPGDHEPVNFNINNLDEKSHETEIEFTELVNGTTNIDDPRLFNGSLAPKGAPSHLSYVNVPFGYNFGTRSANLLLAGKVDSLEVTEHVDLYVAPFPKTAEVQHVVSVLALLTLLVPIFFCCVRLFKGTR